MPKYSGPVELKGTFGNMSFYKRKGVPCVRRPGGFSKERLETDAGLRRVKMQTQEFGAQSMGAKSIRTALAPLKSFCDGTLHNRLIKLGAKLTKKTEGEHGKRPVAFSRFKEHLNNLPLDIERSLDEMLNIIPRSTQLPTRNSATLTLNFDIANVIKWPKGATHCRLVHALAVASDIEWEDALNGYIPIAHEVDGINDLTWSDYIPLGEGNASVTFETTLPADRIPENATVLEVLGITFYQPSGQDFEPLARGKAAKVIGVF